MYNNRVGIFLASVLVIGSITGALAGGLTGEKLGRKIAILIDNCIMVVGKLYFLTLPIFPFQTNQL